MGLETANNSEFYVGFCVTARNEWFLFVSRASTKKYLETRMFYRVRCGWAPNALDAVGRLITP